MTKALKVLILDDQQLIAFEMAKLLEENGFKVIGPFANVTSALACIEDQKPDAAILDINMGDGTTSEFLADEMMAKNLPFVFVTGYGSVDVIPQRFESIVKMHKPVRPEIFISMVKDLTRFIT